MSRLFTTDSWARNLRGRSSESKPSTSTTVRHPNSSVKDSARSSLRSTTSRLLKKNREETKIEGKPMNIFYVWYAELCRRNNKIQANGLRPRNKINLRILDFNGDKIKIDDWSPILMALKLDTSLHVISITSKIPLEKFIEEADTVDKVKRITKWYAAIATKYVLANLILAVGNCLRSNSVLSCLELVGLSIVGEYLEILLSYLSVNVSLRYLSLKCCPIQDDGCSLICSSLQRLPNIEILNLSSCGLGLKSAEYIAKLIKFQQIFRYCESWHQSLRYEEPVCHKMAGLRRITINNNKFKNEGLDFILNELMDDLWIKAIDMQQCGITEHIAEKVFDTINYSKSIQIFDLRYNNLTSESVSKIFAMLSIKHAMEENESTEYHWCDTVTSLDTIPYGSYMTLYDSFIDRSMPTTSRTLTTVQSGTSQLCSTPSLRTVASSSTTSARFKAKTELRLTARLTSTTSVTETVCTESTISTSTLATPEPLSLCEVQSDETSRTEMITSTPTALETSSSTLIDSEELDTLIEEDESENLCLNSSTCTLVSDSLSPIDLLKRESIKRKNIESRYLKLQQELKNLQFRRNHKLIVKELCNIKHYLKKFINIVEKISNEDIETSSIILGLQNASHEVDLLAKLYNRPIELEPSASSESCVYFDDIESPKFNFPEKIEADMQIQGLYHNIIYGTDSPSPASGKCETQGTDRSWLTTSNETNTVCSGDLLHEDNDDWLTEDSSSTS